MSVLRHTPAIGQRISREPEFLTASRTEYRPADANERRPLLDRALQDSAHPHREMAGGRQIATDQAAQLGQLLQIRASPLWVTGVRRDRHETSNPHTVESIQLERQCQGFLWLDPC